MRGLCAIIFPSNSATTGAGFGRRIVTARSFPARSPNGYGLCLMTHTGTPAASPAALAPPHPQYDCRTLAHRARLFVCAAIVALSLLPGTVPPVAAMAALAPLGAPPGQWNENEATTSNRFQIYFAKRDAVAPQVDAYKQVADGALDMMRDIFGTVLVTPVNVYLMTDDAQFVTLVPAAKDDPGRYSGIDRNGMYVSVARSNGLKPADFARNLRGLLARETATEMSGGNLPPGLLDGLERYAQAPPAELPALVGTLQAEAGTDRLTSWNTLLNLTDAPSAPQRYSVVAFLLDTYGFRTFRAYLTKLSTTKDWRQAIPQVYTNTTLPSSGNGQPAAAASASQPGETVTSLEVKWRAYVPQFLNGLWQQNQFAYYNTDEAARAVAAGQYTQAVTLLTPAVPFLQQISNTKRAMDAQALLSKARAGAAAETTVRDAQQALEGNDYDHTLSLVKQAQDEYNAVKDPNGMSTAKPSPLLAEYEARARRGKMAAADLTAAETAVASWNVILARQKANRALGTFTEFGNAPLVGRAQAVVERANREMRYTGLGTIGVGALVLLLGLTITGLRHGGRRQPLALPPIE